MIVDLRDVRLAFADIWEAKPFEAGGVPRFSAVFLMPKDHPSFAAVSKAIKEVATEGWKDKADTMLASIKGNGNKMCFLDGNLKTYDGFQGNYALSGTSKVRFPIVDRNRGILAEVDGRPYAGCYVNAKVDIWCQTKQYPGIRCSILGIQFVRDGDAFSGTRVATADQFDDLSDGSDAPAWADDKAAGESFV